MEGKNTKSSTVNQIITAVIIALLVGGTSPWWWKEFFDKENQKETPRIDGIDQRDAANFTPGTVMIPSKDVFNIASTTIKSVPRNMSRVIETLKTNPEWNVELSVHTDHSGDFDSNIKLRTNGRELNRRIELVLLK